MDRNSYLSELKQDISELLREVSGLKLSALAAVDTQVRSNLNERLGELEVEAEKLTDSFERVESQLDMYSLAKLVEDIDGAWCQLQEVLRFAEARGLPQIWR